MSRIASVRNASLCRSFRRGRATLASRSTPRELGEAPQAGYVGRTPLASQRSASAAHPPAGIDRKLADALGLGADEPVAPASPAGAGVSATMRALERLLRDGRPEFTDR